MLHFSVSSMPSLSQALAIPVLAFCFVVLLMPFLNRLAVKTGFVDHPSSRKIHARPIPLLGGIAVYAGVILVLLLRGSVDKSVMLMMLASFLVMLLGLADDRFDLHSRYRLMLHVAVAAGLSLSGVRFHFFPIEALNHVATVLWIVGVINAMNCLDCADGSAGGTCVVVFGTLAALAIANERFFVAQAALAGMGAVIGFLLFNAPPARVFLGDTGSTFLGLMAAVLAIQAERAPAGYWHLPAAPFVLSVPVFDILWVHYRRYQAGIHSIRDLLASTGKDHLPHRLMALGFSKLACTAMVAYLSALAAAGVYGLAHGVWMGAAMAIVALVVFLWHLERNAEVVIRPDDQVAIYQRVSERPLMLPAAQRERSVL